MITLKGLTSTVWGLAFSPNGERLAATGNSGTLLWDTTAQGTIVASLEFFGSALAYAPDGTSVVIAGQNPGLWNPSSGALDQFTSQRYWYASQVAVRPDGSMVCMTESDWTMGGADRVDDVFRWALPGRNRLPVWSEAQTVGGLAFSPDGELLATAHLRTSLGRRHHPVLLRDPNDGTIRATLHGSTASVSALAFSPDAKHLASLAGITLRVWNLDTQKQVAARKVGSLHFKGFAFTPDSRSLLTVSNDKTVRVWETDTWTETSAYEWKIGKATSIAVAPDGLRAAVGGSTGKVILFDLDA